MMAFLLVNVFFGIVGTFWLRTERRRSEIGLAWRSVPAGAGWASTCIWKVWVSWRSLFRFYWSSSSNMAFLDKLDSYREPPLHPPLSSNPQRLLPPDGRHDLHGNLVPCPQGGKDGSGGGVALRINCLSLRLSIY